MGRLQASGAGFAALYTLDAKVLPAGRDAVTGTDELSTFWQGVLDSGVEGVTLKGGDWKLFRDIFTSSVAPK